MDLSSEQVRALQEPDFKTYLCRDGRPFYIVTIGHRKHILRSFRILGIEEEARQLWSDMEDVWHNLGGRCPIGKMYVEEPYWARIEAIMQRAFLERTAHEWQELFFEGWCPGCAVQTTEEYIRTEHVRESGLVQDVPHPAFGTMVQPGKLVWHRFPVETEDGPTEETVAPVPAADTPWLSGLKVLDFSNVIAGPMCGGLLSRFGADVILVHPLKIDYDPFELVLYGVQAHQGKRSLLVDILSPEGKGILTKLLEWADVVIFNGVERQLKALGLDFDRVHAVNPRALLCTPDMFGGPTGSGRYEGVVGYDDNIQASSGIMARCGVTMEQAEEHAHVGTLDCPCGFAAFLSIAVGLLARQRSGCGSHCRTSLAMTSGYLQLPMMYDHPGRLFDEPAGRIRGAHPLHSYYECGDAAWICLAACPAFASPEQRREATRRLVDAGILTSAEGDGGADAMGQALTRFFLGRTSDEALEACGAVAGAGAARLQRLRDVRRLHARPPPEAGADLRPRGSFPFVVHEAASHPSGLRTTQIQLGGCIRAAEARPRFLAPAPRFGAHTREVLAEVAGYTAAEIDAALAGGVVAERNTQDGVYYPS